MKRCLRLIITLLLVAVTSLQLQAKKHPFVMEGKKWVYKSNTETITYEIQGDTIINDEAFKKMYSSKNGADLVYHGAVQDVDGCIYIIFSGEKEKGIVYDCSDNMESRVTLACGLTYDVYMQQPVDIDGEPYRYLQYWVPPFPDGTIMTGWEICIEGFGCITQDFLCHDSYQAQSFHLSRCFEGVEDLSWVIYNCEELPIYEDTKPKETSSLLRICSNAQGDVYDLQGRKIGDCRHKTTTDTSQADNVSWLLNNGRCKKGVYIVGGRKYVMK